MLEVIAKAIENQQVIQFLYKGSVRTVLPHAIGTLITGGMGLRGYQDDINQWRLYLVENVRYIQVTDRTFTPAAGYQQGDKAMKEIIKELEV